MALTDHQTHHLIIIERVVASLSLVSTLITISTYISIPAFQRANNTLLFFACIPNLFCSVAALIGGSALSKPNSALCQLQAFLLEMFMQSDPMFSLCMAINVWLVFFKRYGPEKLKRLNRVWLVLCLGLPFIPAMVCLFYKGRRGPMYGNATLWCWIDNEWAAERILSYYISVWVCAFGLIVIYVQVGYDVFKKRNQLAAAAEAAGNTYMTNGTGNRDSIASSRGSFAVTHSGNRNSIVSSTGPFTGTRTTQVEISSVTDVSPVTPSRNYSVTINATRHPRASGTPRRRSSSGDRVKKAYLKTAAFFAGSILITWVPSSINRIVGLYHPTNYALNVASALVLPAQGIWTMIIFFVTSPDQCKSIWASWKAKWQERREDSEARRLEMVHQGGRAAAATAAPDTDSMVEINKNRESVSNRESASRGGESVST